jgi:hypothetical protein|tara:strand:- start:241 stop:441 length:201 start_codon:yes stop_codon:yes gene_type:complete
VKPGDLVKQVSNKWTDQVGGDKPMIVTSIRNAAWQDEDYIKQGMIVKVFVNYEIKIFHLAELEVVQ